MYDAKQSPRLPPIAKLFEIITLSNQQQATQPMYVPTAFRVEDPEQIFDFIEHHGFAIIVSNDQDHRPVATHLPLILERDGATPLLVGHFAKGNPQATVSDGRNVLAIFNGPHAFISAGWYGRQNVVPTWNYVAVHVSGTLQVISNRTRLLSVVESLTNKYERLASQSNGNQQPWSLDSVDSEFLDKMLNGITGFEIRIETLEGCWKLNQHHDADRRHQVIHALMTSNNQNDQAIAELMSRS